MRASGTERTWSARIEAHCEGFFLSQRREFTRIASLGNPRHVALKQNPLARLLLEKKIVPRST
jgi:hypothetical protein